MPKILRIEGLEEAISFLNSFPTGMKAGLKTELNNIGDSGVKTMQSNAHVLTGKMKNSIKKGEVTDSKLTIVSPMGYSGYENRRGNPHNFFDVSTNKIAQDAQTRVTNMINSKITNRGK